VSNASTTTVVWVKLADRSVTKLPACASSAWAPLTACPLRPTDPSARWTQANVWNAPATRDVRARRVDRSATSSPNPASSVASQPSVRLPNLRNRCVPWTRVIASSAWVQRIAAEKRAPQSVAPHPSRVCVAAQARIALLQVRSRQFVSPERVNARSAVLTRIAAIRPNRFATLACVQRATRRREKPATEGRIRRRPVMRERVDVRSVSATTTVRM
jgi:hypothetical protein